MLFFFFFNLEAFIMFIVSAPYEKYFSALFFSSLFFSFSLFVDVARVLLVVLIVIHTS